MRAKTTSSYVPVIMNPRQAFKILLNIPEPRRALVLTDAATALRVSEILGLMWADLDFEFQVIEVKRDVRLGRVENAPVESITSPSSHAPDTGWFSPGMEGEDIFRKG